MKLIRSNRVRKNRHARDFVLKKDLKTLKLFKKWFKKNNYGPEFQGIDSDHALALAHTQVESTDPIKMFIVEKAVVGTNKKIDGIKMTSENYLFPSQVILNAKITRMLPKRLVAITKGDKIMQKAEGNVYKIMDGCASFPYEKHILSTRANEIKVEYDYINWYGKLIHVKEIIYGMKSHIFQHEIDHQNGIDIYMPKKQRQLKFINDPVTTTTFHAKI